MGHPNQFLFLKRSFGGGTVDRIIEIGSKDYGSTIPWRKAFPDSDYVGIDLEEGPGVDMTLDITVEGCEVPEPADMLICCSVLEHVKRPWIAAANLERMVVPGGLMYVSVPWVWRYHPYPDDYFRFSFNGVRELFPNVDWHIQKYSTDAQDDFHDAVKGLEDTMAFREPETRRKYIPYLELHSLGVRR